MAEAFLKPVSKDEVIAPKAREIYQKAKVLDSKEIWNILREESESKLARMEMAIDGPSVIKAFNERMECKKLLELQGLGKSHRRMSRVALMFKASVSNLDRTALLMANNPLPDLHALQGGDSPAKYVVDDILSKRLEPTRGRQSGLPPLRCLSKPPPQIPREASQQSSYSSEQCPLGASYPLGPAGDRHHDNSARTGSIPIWTDALLERDEQL